MLDGFAGDGAGRYIGGLAPDVIVRADGSISPIHSYSWVSGFELAPNKATGLYFDDSGLYAQKNATLNSDGTCCVGFGFPGASNAADRLIEEATGGDRRVLWKYENLGSVQWGLQYAHVWVYPWAAGNGRKSANAQHWCSANCAITCPKSGGAVRSWRSWRRKERSRFRRRNESPDDRRGGVSTLVVDAHNSQFRLIWWFTW